MWAGSVKLLFTVAFLASCACQAHAQTAPNPQADTTAQEQTQSSELDAARRDSNPAAEQAQEQQAPQNTVEQQQGFMPSSPNMPAHINAQQQSPQQLQAVESTITQSPTTMETEAEEPIRATPTSGFSIQDTTPLPAPTDSSVSPIVAQPQVPQQQMQPQMQNANDGINMDLNPDMIGGYDPNLPPAAVVPYEVQLQQRNEDIQRQARDQAFERVKKSALPMETYEIRDVLGRLKDTQEAVQTPTRPAPTPKNVIRTVSTDPSATPHTIRLNAGNVTTINIIDVTGEPWPIVDLGFGGFFDVKPPEAGGHVIRITPLKDFAHGNLVVRLLKMTTPITFSLNSGGDEVNYRFDARIPEYGPNARMPLIDEGITAMAGDKTTTSFLEGVPPRGAKKLIMDGGIDARTSAYRYAGALYVRTPLSLLSPAWVGSATSADGTNVYVLEDAPILLLSDRGALVRARVGEESKEFKE